MRIAPKSAQAFKEIGFTAMSVAGNHALDWGLEGLEDTVSFLNGVGIKTAGTGENLYKARQPVFVEHCSERLGMLSYCSVLPEGYWATDKRPGCAPARAHTRYEQIEHDQPGTPCRIHTFMHREDLQNIIDDIKHAKQSCHFLVISIHWGIHFISGQLADYQRELAHAMIDAGADVILGHHPHILKGIEFYQQKPIVYSMGNFAIEQPYTFMPDLFGSESYREIKALGGDWNDNAKYMAPTETRYTYIVKCVIEGNSLKDFLLVPCYINDDSEPELVGAGTALYQEMMEYLDKITQSEGLATEYAIDNHVIRPYPR